jgi:DNA invertase Pin-like site-specific DNA recombinase
MRVALYARVSKGGEQDPANQLRALREWAKGAGVEVVGEYVDEVSSRDTRPKKEEVLRLLRLGQIDGVAFWSLDRWGRTMSELVLEFEEASQRGWQLISLREGLRLDTVAGRLYAHLLAAFANFERERIRERTLAGLARARAQGKRLGGARPGAGRPRKSTSRVKPPGNPASATT